MPILVVCPGCKTEFRVSEKFAGKSGKCPKCKGDITVPAVEEVTIAEPEPAVDAKKDAQGRPVSKPIEREKTRVTPLWGGLIGGGAVATCVAAWLLGPTLREALWLRALGVLLVSPPLAWAGYAFLRDSELEPHRGQSLALRVLICGLVYALLWGVFAALPEAWAPRELWQWFLVTPPFVLVGAGVALACFDLDFGTGTLHYGFYLLTTGLLRAAAGMPALWAMTKKAAWLEAAWRCCWGA